MLPKKPDQQTDVEKQYVELFKQYPATTPNISDDGSLEQPHADEVVDSVSSNSA